MVYCGKPSRGCQMCRTRRIKCDETKPTCLQCQKSRRQCPGYKDDFDLVFRNETQATERRARRAGNGKRGHATMTLAKSTKSPEGSSSLITPDSAREMSISPQNRYGTHPAPMLLPAIPTKDQAPCYFVQNYVLHQQEDSKRGYFDFLLPMLKNEGPESHLTLAFSAVSLASLANRPNTRASGMMSQAIGAYAKALRALNLALQNTALQKTDQTLAAILMMGFFENIASEKTNPMAWYSHVEGAVQLVKMRGKKQLRTKVGYSLFMSVRSQMAIQCMTSSKAPSLGTDWWFTDEKKEDFASFTMRLSLRIAELRSDINNALASYPRTPEYFQKVLELIRRAHMLDQEYLGWENTVPDDHRPKTVAWVDQVPGGDITKAEIFPGKVDMYEDLGIATTWNHLRIARLFISGSIVRCAAWICSPVDYRTTPEYAQAVRLSQELITDILASVPFHLGWRVDVDGTLKPPTVTPNGLQTVTGLSGPRGIGGVFLMWPLFTVSNMDYTSDSQRKWNTGRMVYLSEFLGLNHAKVLSNFQLRLPSMSIRRDAIVHATLGGYNASGMHANAYPQARRQSPSYSNPKAPITSQTLANIPATEDWGGSPPPESHSPIGNGQNKIVYALNPHQQREQMQKEAWDKDRKTLLSKASGGQGDTTERLMANYLAV